MPNGNSVIDLSKSSKPITVFLKKISSAVGIVYEPIQIKRIARAKVEAKKIKALGKIELDEIEQRGIDRLIRQQAIKQKNIENIVKKAMPLISKQAKTEDLEEDWIVHFFDKCDKISDEKMQSLWSSLLAGEATKPGTYSKRTVDLMASMDKNDAELFTQLCQFTWIISIDNTTPLIFDYGNEIYTKCGINLGSLEHLKSIGLITFDSVEGYKIGKLSKNIKISYYDKSLTAELQKDRDNTIGIGQVFFTKVGEQLERICDATQNQEFYEYAIEQMSKKGITLSSPIPNAP